MLRLLAAALLTASFSAGASAQWPVRNGPAPATPDALSVPNTYQEGQIVAPVARVTVFVRDMDKSLQFYRGILKLNLAHDAVIEGEAVNKFLGTKGAKLRTVILTPSNTTIGNVGLYQIIGPKDEVGPISKDNFAHTGDFALVWVTNSIWDIYNEAKAQGFPTMNPPVTLMARPKMKTQGVEMSIRDPDGIMVNITQAGVPE